MTANKDDAKKYPAMYGYFNGSAVLLIAKKKQEVVRWLRSYAELKDSIRTEDTGAIIYTLNKMQDDICLMSGITYGEIPACVSLVAKFGADKYGDGNYRKGMLWSRFLNAMKRHFDSIVYCDYHMDDDSGLPHSYHILANIHIIAEYVIDGLGTNDLLESKPNENETTKSETVSSTDKDVGIIEEGEQRAVCTDVESCRRCCCKSGPSNTRSGD